jgi:cytochrome P450
MGTVAVGSRVEQLLAELVSRAGREDPYRVYAALRADAPIAVAADGSLLLTRYRDCWAALRNPAIGHGDPAVLESVGGVKDWRDHLSLWQLRTSMLALDPPAHTRLRTLVGDAFTPRRVAALRGAIEATTGRLIEELGDGSDFIAAFAFPLPIAVIGDLLGVPAVDQPQFQHLAKDWTRVLDVTTPRILARADAAAAEIRGYLSDLADHRRRAPRDDLVSALIAGEGADRLRGGELLTMAALLFAAGFETATHLLGNGLVALLRHPAELDRWRRSPELGPAAVDELLRYDSSVQIARRVALRDTVIGETNVAAGQALIVCLGAANRDPARYPDPDRLDLGRADGAPLSFGAGVHYCLGATLARLEGQVAFPALIDRFPDLHIAGDVHHRASMTVRGYSRIPVALTGGSG